MRLLKSIFIPAITNALHSKRFNTINESPYDYKFFTSKSFFQYPYILTSSYYSLHYGIPNFRQYYQYPSEYKLVADSGGFQMATFARSGKTMDVTPLQILRWMETNADIGMNLDIPPWDDFNAALKQSIENFKFFEQNRLNYRMKLYNVLHGNSLDQMKVWYASVKDFNFDGWALGVKPTDNIFLQLIGYLFLREKDALHLENFHMFGMSSMRNMITNAIISNHFDTTIAFDSSSYNTGSRFRKFCFPKDISHSIEFGRNNKKTLTSIPCKCPVCRNITINDLYDPGENGYMLLHLHNLYQCIEVNRSINAIVSDSFAFEKYCKSVGLSKIYNIINSILTDYEIRGVTRVYEKYKHLMTIGEEPLVQKNIGAFTIQ